MLVSQLKTSYFVSGILYVQELGKIDLPCRADGNQVANYPYCGRQPDKASSSMQLTLHSS